MQNLSGNLDEPQKDVYELRYSGAIRFDSTLSGFETIMKVLNENLNAYQQQDGMMNMSPKPQRQRGQKNGQGENDNISVAAPKSRVQQNKSRELTAEDISLLRKMDEPFTEDTSEI